jgi:5-(carboxyamino)imidazole ribonucleotide mutase
MKNRRQDSSPLVGIIMGSGSDWDTMKYASKTLRGLGVPHETLIVSAHRTPDRLFDYASSGEKRGIEVIIAGAGGAAHLPGMTASKTVLPVLGVPVESKALKGLDSLLSIAQMPGGIPVGTLSIGKSGAVNAALLAASILGVKHRRIREALRKFRTEQTARVLAHPDPSQPAPSSKKRKRK